jgi:hypothetical protein
MGTTLQNLRRFVVAKNNEEERGEIREYVLAHAPDLAEALNVSVASFEVVVSSVDDARLAHRLVDEITRANRDHRSARAAERARAAQQSADIIGRTAKWEGDRANVDVRDLLASALTHRHDALVFACDAFTICIPMAPLFDIARLKRVDLSAFVDAEGLHIRWRSGGLNFKSTKADPKRSGTISVHLSRAATRAA